MEKWQYTYRNDWDATDGRNSVRNHQGAVAMVLDLAKAFEWVSLSVVLSWATHPKFPGAILRVLCGYFDQRRVHDIENDEQDRHIHEFTKHVLTAAVRTAGE